MAMQTMVILEHCAGGNLHQALKKDMKRPQRELVRGFAGFSLS
jgi:hypothetical protein